MDLPKRGRQAAAVAAAAFAFFSHSPASAMEPEVRLQISNPGRYLVEGRFTVDAATSTAWDVITDYDGIDRFVSSMKSSRTLRREPDGARIEQVGRGSFLFFSKIVKLTLDVRETPGSVEFQKVFAPDFVEYRGWWRIASEGDGCTVTYRLEAEPAPGLGPRFAAQRALRKGAQQLLNDVRLEIMRRKKPEL